ncbi:LTA synthase family protein [Nocardioides stalactiti]|uniref:LTA synthase family protein n=1 Tax=Nocardioides stalactiti TaxID=2755356 RepID=UPI0015FF1FB7|nr:LTA synthase family protein [Nocardioides stalactiti]
MGGGTLLGTRMPPRTDRRDDPPALRRRPHPVPLVLALITLKLLLARVLMFGWPTPGMVLTDLASAAVLVGLVGLVAHGVTTSTALWALNSGVSIFLASIVVYYSYFQTLPTFTALHEADQADDVRSSIAELLDAHLLLFFADLPVAAVAAWFLLGERWLPPRPIDLPSRLRILGALVLIGTSATAAVIDANADVRNEQYRAEELGVIGYELDALLRSWQPPPRLDLATAYDQVAALKSGNHTTITDPSDARGFGAAAGKNLIMVQMESLQQWVLGLEVAGQEVTPHLNDLARSSYSFPHHYQQVGRGNSVDAEFATNTSIYPVGETPMSTAYGDRELPSLPKLLRSRGYTSETFNVNWAEFWDHDKLFAAVGFDQWHEKDYFPGPDFNVWGASDDVLYARGLYRLLQLRAEGAPFYAQLVTASGHGPFDVPDHLVGLDLPDELRGTLVGAYLQAQNYADRALGTFIRGLKQTGLWEDSLFVVYGDHAGLNTEDTVEDVRRLVPDYDFGRRFNTALLFHVPGQVPSVETQVAGQLDILPTVANLLGVSLAEERFVAFGVDLLNTDRHALSVPYHAPTGTFVNDEVMFSPGRGFADGRAARLDDGEQTSIDGLRDDYDYVLDLIDLSRAYVESLPRR